MSVNISENLIGIWYIRLPTGHGHDDWLASLEETPEGIQLAHRFRHSDPLEPGADPWENIDKKTWRYGLFKGKSRDEAVKSIDEMASLLALMAGTGVWRCMMNPERDVMAFIEEFKKLPFVHLKEGKEAEQYMNDGGL